jgi:hypothetical protein
MQALELHCTLEVSKSPSHRSFPAATLAYPGAAWPVLIRNPCHTSSTNLGSVYFFISTASIAVGLDSHVSAAGDPARIAVFQLHPLIQLA